MSYPLLDNAPPQDSPEFIEYLRTHNTVEFENDQWIVIQNCNYHTEEKPWLTAFHKARIVADNKGFGYTFWYEDIDILWYEYGDWQWLKKATKDQTVPGRFHIHLTKGN